MLPPRPSMETLFTGGVGAKPGPMTMVSSFFSNNYADRIANPSLNYSMEPWPLYCYISLQQKNNKTRNGTKMTGIDEGGDLEFCWVASEEI